MSRSNFIPDGYTISAYIAERPGLYQESRFTYRPVLHGERARIVAAMSNAKEPKDASRVIYQTIEKQIVSWDQVDRANEPLKATAVNIARMAPEFVERLFNVICGYQASNDDPAIAPQATKGEQDELDRLLEGESAVEAVEKQAGADAKN